MPKNDENWIISDDPFAQRVMDEVISYLKSTGRYANANSVMQYVVKDTITYILYNYGMEP